MNQANLHKALWWTSEDNGFVKCGLCPRYCRIADGKTGFCAVRKNEEGVLYSLSYGYPVALQIDPIEKKPLYHFMRGTRTFSLGTLGCNLYCIFCQNHHLSRGYYLEKRRYEYYSPEKIVELTQRHGCQSISYTYSEPTIFGEYVMDIARLARKAGLKNILVSNGYMTLEAAKDIAPLMDAANIDMKGFSEDFYMEMTKAHLQPVLDFCEYYNSIGGHLELANLIIPGKNDSPEMLDAYLNWVESKLGIETPLHFTAYHPDFEYDASPRTPAPLIYSIQEYAVSRGFPHVYAGNVFFDPRMPDLKA